MKLIHMNGAPRPPMMKMVETGAVDDRGAAALARHKKRGKIANLQVAAIKAAVDRACREAAAAEIRRRAQWLGAAERPRRQTEGPKGGLMTTDETKECDP